MSGASDFDFLHREWKVRHRKLRTRLAGADDWVEFDGTSTTRPILGGAGNVEDNFLDDPAGPYRAAALRSFDAETGLWRIWWLDLRQPGELGTPVAGRFDGDIGEFSRTTTGTERPSRCVSSGTGTPGPARAGSSPSPPTAAPTGS